MKIVPFHSQCLLVPEEVPLTTNTFTTLNGLPSFSKWTADRTVIFRPVFANVEFIVQNFPHAQWVDGAEAHVENLRAVRESARRVTYLKSAALPPERRGANQYQYKRKPREHQRRALLMSWEAPAFALLMEQRTGKTKVIIDNAAYLFKKKLLTTLVVVTINGVHRNWIDNEIPEDLPDWVHRECFFMLGSHNSSQKYRFQQTLSLKNGLRIFSFNVEGLSREGGLARELFELSLADGAKTMLVIDESSDCIKNFSAKRTKYLLHHSSAVAYRRILTGTQSPEGRPDELFPQYSFLDENILGYDTIGAFRNRYCVTKTFKVNGRNIEQVLPGCKNVDELRSKIEGFSFRVRRSDCMDLPPKIYKTWPVELSKEQRTIYEQIKEEFIAQWKGHTLTAPLAITRLIRLQQIISGWFAMEEESMVDDIWQRVRPINPPNQNPRFQALLDTLRTNEDAKTIIWSRFRPDLDMISRELGPVAVSYHGGISQEQKAINYKRFQNDPSVRYFVANQSSAGRGLTLTAATLLIYYTNSFRLVDRLQSEDRAEGDQSKRDSTLVIDIQASDTMDKSIIQRLRQKKNIADIINGDPTVLFGV